MTEQDVVDEGRLLLAFADFRSDTRGGLPAADLGEVRHLARRRRTTQLAALAVVAAVLAATPVAAYAFRGGPVDRTEPATVASGEPTGAPSDPDGPPTGSAPPATSASAAPLQPPITERDLNSAVLDIPEWGDGGNPSCPSGQHQMPLRNRDSAMGELSAGISKTVAVDLDRDGDTEIAALLYCGVQGHVYQVVTFGRDPNGGIRTLGQVVASSDNKQVGHISAIRADTGGRVGVEVYEDFLCCGTDERYVARQWRSYGWNGSRFGQVGGPTTFPAKVAAPDLGVVLGPVDLQGPMDMLRTGRFSVTVHNHGPQQAPGVSLTVYLSSQTLRSPLRIVGEGCTSTEIRDAGKLTGVQASCHLGALAANGDRTFWLDASVPVATNPAFAQPAISVSATVAPEQPGVRLLRDPNPDNDESRVEATFK